MPTIKVLNPKAAEAVDKPTSAPSDQPVPQQVEKALKTKDND